MASSGNAGTLGPEASGSTRYLFSTGRTSSRCPSPVFLGFPPFAVVCHEMYVAVEKLLTGMAERPTVRLAFWLLVAAYIGLAFWGIDVWTVRSFQS